MRALILLSALLFHIAAHAQGSAVAPIPVDAQRVIQTAFASYRVAPARTRQSAGPAEASHVFGDFDGDGTIDVAVMLEKSANPETRVIAALFKRNGQYIAQYAGVAQDWIHVFHAGEKDFSYATGRNFRYALDTVFTGIDEKAGYSLIYRNGNFFIDWTSD